MGILQFINLWHNRKNKFKEEYGVDFPETEKQRCEITNQVASKLIKIYRLMLMELASMEQKKQVLFDPFDPISSVAFDINLIIYSKRVKEFERLAWLACFAGFPKKFIDYVKEKSEEIGAIT